MGYFVGGLTAGLLADAIGFSASIAIVAGLTILSGLWVWMDLPGRPAGWAGERVSPAPWSPEPRRS
jgi:predicted MFS family arabinose efflux permease